MRVAVYARFSSDLQDARSITDQIALAREHAGRQGWLVVGEFTDAAISGASMANRPGLQDLMRAAEARRFDAVLTESLDRLSRDLADSAALHRQLAYWGVRIVTLADGDVTKMLVAVKGLLGSMFLDEHRAAHLCRIRRRALATEDRAGPECRGNPGASGRGGHWNVSALLGSAKRRNGLLNNSLYAGAHSLQPPELHQGSSNRPPAGAT